MPWLNGEDLRGPKPRMSLRAYNLLDLWLRCKQKALMPGRHSGARGEIERGIRSVRLRVSGYAAVTPLKFCEGTSRQSYGATKVASPLTDRPFGKELWAKVGDGMKG
jgi:hypothetical protein